MKNFVNLLLLTLVLGISAFAQEELPVYKLGVVNEHADKLVKPEYPAAAKVVNAGGVVNVNVLINENGKVIFAKAVSGHALLREASETAALQSSFLPPRLEGKPIKVQGILVFNFVGNYQPQPFQTFEDFSKFGEVLNTQALSLPKPEYPDTARAIKAQGPVVVEVLVDERGTVTSARALSGHPLLLNESEKAALKARFKPTMIDGKAVEIKGTVVYNFVAN